ncbi:MAG: hypothetical protein EHM33_33160, partial [Chloroflexi bacterium]
MKKVLVIVVLLVCSSFVFAGPPTAMEAWWIWITATDMNGTHWAGDLGIGWDEDYTNGYDPDHPLYGDENWPVQS